MNVKEIMVKEPYATFLNRYEMETTKKAYAYDLTYFDRYIEGKEPYLATTDDLESFVTNMVKQKLKTITIKRRMGCLHKFFQRGIKRKLITEDPTLIFEDIKLRNHPRAPKSLSKEQREHLKASLKWDTPFHCRVSLMVTIGIYTGLRRSEMRFLRWEDINFVTKKLKVIGKGSKEAYLPLVKPLLEKLKECEKTGLVLGSTDHSAIEYWCRIIVKKWCGWESEVKFSCHVLRHSFITELAEMKVPPDVLMELARHSKFDMTKKYIKVLDEKKAFEIERVFT